MISPLSVLDRRAVCSISPQVENAEFIYRENPVLLLDTDTFKRPICEKSFLLLFLQDGGCCGRPHWDHLQSKRCAQSPLQNWAPNRSVSFFPIFSTESVWYPYTLLRLKTSILCINASMLLVILLCINLSMLLVILLCFNASMLLVILLCFNESIF
jgi:hypothetical protein